MTACQPFKQSGRHKGGSAAQAKDGGSTMPVLAAALLWLLATLTPASGAEGDILDWPSLLKNLCNVTQLPAPDSNIAFLGPLQRLNTTRSSYAYYRFGNATSGRPPLVLVNGLASTMHDWAPSTLRALGARQEVLIYDNPGEGLSKELDPPPELTIADMAEDALEFYDALGLEQPNLLGLSMGGQIAITLAAMAGDRLGKVVLAPGDAGGYPHSRMNETEVYQKIKGLTITFVEFVQALFPLDTPQGREAVCRYGLDKAGGISDPNNLRAFQRHTQAIVDFVEGPGVWEQLPEVRNSVLLINGGKDPLMPAQDAVAMVPQLSPAQPWLALYPQALHGVFMQESESILQLVDNFLLNG